MQPVQLGANQPRQFYKGGQAIADLRGMTGSGDFGPEDWVASATPRFGRGTDGLTVMPDGRFLRDVIEADPKGWLGPEHAEYFGTDPALLVKLLDAGQRLPVHVHPDRSFAVRHLGSRHGKTEAWVVLGTTGSEALVYVGWKRDVDQPELSRLLAQQGTAALLGLLNKLTVEPGDAVLVPAGTAHAIGANVFCLELQEPTDFSIMLEVQGFDIDPADAYLGLDREVALSCVSNRTLRGPDLQRVALQADHRGGKAAATAAPRDGGLRNAIPGGGSVEDILPEGAAPYFRAQRARGGENVSLEPSFAVIVVDSGAGAMKGEGWEIETKRGDTFVVPWSAGETKVLGPVELLRCLPPRPVDAAKDDPGATEMLKGDR
jgi:mannose-6-phosphate isomerase